MQILDLMNLETAEYTNRRVNVFFQNNLFKVRVIELEAGGEIPECQMESYVMLYVVQGDVLLRKNNESSLLKENQVFITAPAMLSMKTISGARLMGVQI